jgi:hypothetical protein
MQSVAYRLAHRSRADGRACMRRTSREPEAFTSRGRSTTTSPRRKDLYQIALFTKRLRGPRTRRARAFEEARVRCPWPFPGSR